jgi:hypothetical protein
MSIRNLDYLRGKDPRLYEALQDIVLAHQNLAQQVNGNSTGQPQAPPPPAGVTVQAANGHFQVAIQDRGDIYRGIHYHVEHADNPHFTNSHTEHLGPTRNANLFLGNSTRYFRVYSSYASSPPSAAVYHGGPLTPAAVAGGGTVGPPPFLPSEGSGTGAAGQGLSGPGPVPFRSATGAPPIR